MRKALINAYYTLEYAISDYQRGRVEFDSVRQAYGIYRKVCTELGEGHFCLADIAHDKLPHIPYGYPAVPPADLPKKGDVFDTPVYSEYMRKNKGN